MTLGVLGPRQSEVEADAPVEHLHLGLGVGVSIDASEPDDAAAVDQLVLDPSQAGREGREREVLTLDVEDIL